MPSILLFQSHKASVGQLLRTKPALPVQSYLVIVEFEQRVPVRHREQSYVQLFGLVVEFRLHVHTHSAGALVQDGEQGTVVEQPSHRHTLLLSSRQDVCPIVN